MKKNSLSLILLTLFLMSCTDHSYLKLRVEIPSAPPLPLDQYDEIVVTNFFLEKEVEGFDLSKNIKDYLKHELEFQYKGKISTEEIAPEQESLLKDAGFWKQNNADRQKALFITGKAQYSQETRKAILGKEKKRFDDPFTEEKKWAERKIFTLQMDLYFIKAESGEVLLERSYKETSSYENQDQSLDFAFSDLMQRVKTKLFRNIFGMERIQERYLLAK